MSNEYKLIDGIKGILQNILCCIRQNKSVRRFKK